MSDEVKLSDSEIALSPLGPGDFEAHRAGEDEEFERWLSGGPSGPEELREYLRRCAEWWETGGPLCNFGVRVGPEQVLAGTMDVQFDRWYLPRGQVNLAYGIYPAWRGRGIATRAVELACDFAASRGAAHAVIRCEPDNDRSAKVAERAGFTYVERRPTDAGHALDWYIRALF